MNKKGITLIELIVIIAIATILLIIVGGTIIEAKQATSFEDYTYVVADGQTYRSDEIKRIEDESWTNGNSWRKENFYVIIFENGGRQKVSGYYFTNTKPKES